MKLKQILASTLFILALVSCKNDTKEVAKPDAAKLPETFNIAFNLTVLKDDTFQLFYTEDGSLNFGEQKSVKSVIKGSPTAQEILFKLPADVLPTNIRLDFGDNKAQDEITVNSMRLKYFAKTFNASENVVKKYFYTNDFQLKYDDKTSKVKAVITNGVYDPLMWSNDALGGELTKIIK